MPSAPFRTSSPFPPSSPFRKTRSPEPSDVKEKSPQTSPKPGNDKEPAFGERWMGAANPQRPSFSTTGKPGEPARRQSSILFNTGSAETTLRRESKAHNSENTGIRESTLRKPGEGSGRKPSIYDSRRRSSPPPPSTYQRGVSFNTFDNKDATDLSLTLNYTHKDYKATRRSRTFLCGTDTKDYSEFALEWLLDELVDDGDQVVCLRVIETDSKIAGDASVKSGKYHQEARKLLDQVIEKNAQEEKAISLVMELAVGKVQEVIQRMIQIYEPACLVVGTRGRSLGGVQGLLPGSVSKYCLQSSPIPVIVVRPETKRTKKKKKRLADPNRRTYNTILEQTGYGTYVLDKTNRSNSIIGPLPLATDDEAKAVAQAIGVPENFKKPKYGGRLKRVTSKQSEGSDVNEDDESPSPTGGYFPAGYMRSLSPDPVWVAMQSPAMDALDWSDTDEDEDEAADKSKKAEEKTKETAIAKDDSDDEWKPAAITKKDHAPSFSEKPGWLKAILENQEPQGPAARRRSSTGRGSST